MFSDSSRTEDACKIYVSTNTTNVSSLNKQNESTSQSIWISTDTTRPLGNYVKCCELEPIYGKLKDSNSESIATFSHSKPKPSNTNFSCQYCSFQCTWKYDLKVHLKQKHRVHR